jgi:hypothetical protein
MEENELVNLMSHITSQKACLIQDLMKAILGRTKKKSALRFALVYLSLVKNKSIYIQATKMDKNKCSD